MTENQKIWLEELIKEYNTAADNEHLWALGSQDDPEGSLQHEENAEECREFAKMLSTLLED